MLHFFTKKFKENKNLQLQIITKKILNLTQELEFPICTFQFPLFLLTFLSTQTHQLNQLNSKKTKLSIFILFSFLSRQPNRTQNKSPNKFKKKNRNHNNLKNGYKTWSLWWWLLSPEIEAATDALAERTPVEAVLIQEEINFKELGIKPLLWWLRLWLRLWL